MVINRILNSEYNNTISNKDIIRDEPLLYEHKTPSSYQSLSGKALTPTGLNSNLQGMSVPPVRLASRPTNITEGPTGNRKNNIHSKIVHDAYLNENPDWLKKYGKTSNPTSLV
jgi:hypothetical protein